MNEREKQCVYCKAKLFDDDEVVYCPVCGAPHHKDCYSECGHCALEHLHGTENEYDPHPENKTDKTDGIPRDREGHTCRHCGKMSSSDTIFCPYCGTPFFEAQSNDTDRGERSRPYVFHVDLLGGVDKDEKIDGINVSDLASFVRVNTRRYIPLFKDMDDNKRKTSWNWSAFLFPCAWNAYRKNYMAAGVLLAVLASAFYLVSSLVFVLNTYIGTLPVNSQLTASVLFEAFATVDATHWILFGAGLIMDIISRIISALFGDYWYKTRITEKYKEITTDPEIENAEEVLQKKGGVNQWLGMLALYPSVLMIYQCGSLLLQVISWLMAGGL